jgi:hypothetical protein
MMLARPIPLLDPRYRVSPAAVNVRHPTSVATASSAGVLEEVIEVGGIVTSCACAGV